MSQGLIVLGDKTSHGGTVISCAPTSNTLGKGWARIGDMVACPRCKGVFPISQGDATLKEDGKPVAYHGCKTACGATLIASQQHTTTDPAGGAGPGATGGDTAATLGANVGNIGGGMAASYEEEALDDAGQRYRGRFRLLDAATGEPIANHTMRLRSTGGQYLTGTTDEDGYTQWVDADSAEALAFDLQPESSA